MLKVLVIGGTGNMGRPLVKSLADAGSCVSVVCRKKVKEEDAACLAGHGGGYFYGDAKDKEFMSEVLARHYDAIVDFCIYSSEEFSDRMNMLLDATDQYVCLSTAAVYADMPTPKNESSPRYMEVDPPKDGTAKWGWYCYEKARIENLLFSSGKRNWTIVRPGITMNSNHVGWGLWWDDAWCGRIIRGRKVVVEEDMLAYKFSISSGAQVAALIYSVIRNQKAMGEVFNVCSSEVWSWQEMLDAYRRIFSKHGYDLNVKYVKSQDIIGTNTTREYWYKRARLLDRVFDNSKILSVVPPQASGKNMLQLLTEWTESYITNFRTRKLDNGQLRQAVELDRLTGDCSSCRDFCSSSVYFKYLIMRYFPIGLALYCRLKRLVRSAIQHIFGRRS